MIPERVNEAINEQIKNELESYYIYLSMAAYFHSISLDGMARWMRD
ncbi:MAG: ferritin-like domain-containing protein [Desulfobacteraceae bacterium]